MSIGETDKEHFNNCSVSIIKFENNKKPFVEMYNYYDYLGELK